VFCRILAVGNDIREFKRILAGLSQKDIELAATPDSEEALELIQRLRPHLVLIDLGPAGMRLRREIYEFDPQIDVVLLEEDYGPTPASEAQGGAANYLNQPAIDGLCQRIRILLSEIRRRQNCADLAAQLFENCEFAGMVGNSPAMLEVFREIRQLAPRFRNLLLTGSSGVGKDIAARALHRLSPVASAPFVTYRCSTISDPVPRGTPLAFSQDLVGALELGSGGTVFLDGFGELSSSAQEKLLREVEGQRSRLRIRIIAAARRYPAPGKGRDLPEDLFRRLFAMHIRLPSLVERKEDLPLLERHFVQQFAEQYRKAIEGIDLRAQVLLAKHAWPGNVRELETALETAVKEASGHTVGVNDLPEYIRRAERIETRQQVVFATLEETETSQALYVLESFGGNVTEAAKSLGTSRTKLYRILRKSDSSGAQRGPIDRHTRLVTDSQWAKIAPLLGERPRPRVGGRPSDDRLVLEGILRILRNGGHWYELRAGLPCTTTCWRRLRDWTRQGIWPEIWRAFLAELNDEETIRWSKYPKKGAFGTLAAGNVLPARTPRAGRRAEGPS
jgi:DNA-binding NtrC family response regulator/transposase